MCVSLARNPVARAGFPSCCTLARRVRPQWSRIEATPAGVEMKNGLRESWSPHMPSYSHPTSKARYQFFLDRVYCRASPRLSLRRASRREEMPTRQGVRRLLPKSCSHCGLGRTFQAKAELGSGRSSAELSVSFGCFSTGYTQCARRTGCSGDLSRLLTAERNAPPPTRPAPLHGRNCFAQAGHGRGGTSRVCG